MRMLNTGNKIFGNVSTTTLFEKEVHTIFSKTQSGKKAPPIPQNIRSRV